MQEFFWTVKLCSQDNGLRADSMASVSVPLSSDRIQQRGLLAQVVSASSGDPDVHHAMNRGLSDWCTMASGAGGKPGITLTTASVKDTVKVLKVPAREVEMPFSSSSTEGFIQWMLQKGFLVNPAQEMDLEKVQAVGQELLAAAGTGSKMALQHIPGWGALQAGLRRIRESRSV